MSTFSSAKFLDECWWRPITVSLHQLLPFLANYPALNERTTFLRVHCYKNKRDDMVVGLTNVHLSGVVVLVPSPKWLVVEWLCGFFLFLRGYSSALLVVSCFFLLSFVLWSLATLNKGFPLLSLWGKEYLVAWFMPRTFSWVKLVKLALKVSWWNRGIIPAHQKNHALYLVCRLLFCLPTRQAGRLEMHFPGAHWVTPAGSWERGGLAHFLLSP